LVTIVLDLVDQSFKSKASRAYLRGGRMNAIMCKVQEIREKVEKGIEKIQSMEVWL